MNKLTMSALLLSALTGYASADTYAMVYGVANYPKVVNSAGTVTDNSLKGPTNDVPDFEKLLRTNFKVPSSQMRIRLNDKAIGQNLVEDLKWLTNTKGLKQGDTVVWYFSGHGIQIPTTAVDEKDGIDEGIVLYDCYIPDNEVYSLRKALNSAGVNIVFVFDSCFSGGLSRSPFEGIFKNMNARFTNRKLEFKSIPTLEFKNSSKKRLERRTIFSNGKPKGFTVKQVSPTKAGYGIILSASQESQVAIEVSDVQNNIPARGIFSWVLSDMIRENPKASIGGIMNAIISEFRKEGVSATQEPQIEWFGTDMRSKPLLSQFIP